MKEKMVNRNDKYGCLPGIIVNAQYVFKISYFC